MKKFVVIFALFMLLKPILPVLEYVAFYDYIKNELCINKDKVELQCNGKCHLAKEMAKTAEIPENGQDKKQVQVETSIVFYQDILQDYIKNVKFWVYKPKTVLYYSLSYSYLQANSVFRPPIA